MSTADQLTATLRSNPATLKYNSNLPIDCLSLKRNLIDLFRQSILFPNTDFVTIPRRFEPLSYSLRRLRASMKMSNLEKKYSTGYRLMICIGKTKSTSEKSLLHSKPRLIHSIHRFLLSVGKPPLNSEDIFSNREYTLTYSANHCHFCACMKRKCRGRM